MTKAQNMSDIGTRGVINCKSL